MRCARRYVAWIPINRSGRWPLIVEEITATATGFPFVRTAKFDAGVAELNQILDVGWRTARLCAHETYMDCPYYEQLQYSGDTRVQIGRAHV